tara:strand:+ start:1041 stop:1676 length:636 start_codon:yes stop_codon:yes gene_type:complete
MNDWWAVLGGDEKVFYGIAFVSSLIMGIQLVLTLIGGALDSPDGEFEVEGTDGDLGVLSIRTISAFFVGFGWGGITAMNVWPDHPSKMFISTAAGGFCGLVFLWTVWKTMKGLHSLKSDGTVDYANAVGNVGTVYIPVHPSRKGGGQIQVKVQGRERTLQAITDSETEIRNMEKVEVLEKIDQHTVLVAPLSADSNDPIETNPPENKEGKE